MWSSGPPPTPGYPIHRALCDRRNGSLFTTKAAALLTKAAAPSLLFALAVVRFCRHPRAKRRIPRISTIPSRPGHFHLCSQSILLFSRSRKLAQPNQLIPLPLWLTHLFFAFSAQKSRVKPPNHLNRCHTTTSQWQKAGGPNLTVPPHRVPHLRRGLIATKVGHFRGSEKSRYPKLLQYRQASNWVPKFQSTEINSGWNPQNKGKIACQAPKPPKLLNPNHLAVAFKLPQIPYT